MGIASTHHQRRMAHSLALGLCLVLAACASSTDKPKPADLARNTALVGVRQAWVARLPEMAPGMQVSVQGQTLALASADGTVLALDGSTGRELWRSRLPEGIAAGVGSDGRGVAVVTRGNELVALEAGRELWRHKLPAQAYTAPLVAGGRVFVLTADRSVMAFDGQTGLKLWGIQRPGEALVLRQAGVLTAVGDTLVVGLSGRLVGLHPLTGSVRWDVPIASPRGTNDVERLVDLVAPVARQGSVVCARAFQSAVGCVDAGRGTLLWTRPAHGAVGLHADTGLIYGTELDSKLMAWKRAGGELAWSTERLQWRGLTAPLAIARGLVVGDSEGWVHLVSREDGSALNRLPTDGSAIVAAPVLVGETVVVVTKKGGVFGFKPD